MAGKTKRGIVFSVMTLKLIKYCLVLTMHCCSTTICSNSSGVVVISIRGLSGSLTLGPYLLSVSSTCETNALLTAMNSTACSESVDLLPCRGDLCLLLCCKQQRMLQSRERKAVREGEPYRCKPKVKC